MTESPDREAGTLLDRRDAIRLVSFWLGGVTFVGGSGLIGIVDRAHAAAAARSGPRIGEFDEAQIALLDEIAETILPATHTPGAKAARTGAFMALMVTDGYGAAERQIFLDGMRDVDAAMVKAHAVSFTQASAAQRLELLTVLDSDQKRIMDAREVAERGLAPVGKRPATPYFRMMKELAMLGFFTSEIGCTQAQRYVESPGRYDPCIVYVKGEPAFARHA